MMGANYTLAKFFFWGIMLRLLIEIIKVAKEEVLNNIEVTLD